jgi:hypothetical protein
MILIRQKRIRNLERHLPAELKGKKIRIGVSLDDRYNKQIEKIGIGMPAKVGESVLPSVIGPATRFNAEGRQLVRRDLPMETAHRQILWTWKEFHGRDQIERTDVREIPYSRYPREFMPPPSLELMVQETDDSQKVIVTISMLYDETNSVRILQAINVFLEIFGDCQVFTENLKALARTQIKRLNWKILPPGKYPWEKLRRELDPIIQRARKGNRALISYRLEKIEGYKPDFIAVGEAGFTGYVVFGFPSKNRYVFESSLYGNATYVFDKDWEELSKWTKAEILNQNRQRARIIHRESWEASLQKQVA